MKSLQQHIQEKLVINKNYDPYQYHPTSWNELRRIIKDRYEELGPGTKQEPIDFNDIDVSKMTTFYELFKNIPFRYIDLSDWNISRIEYINKMFYECKQLESIGDISEWDVSNVTNMMGMFMGCKLLISVGDISSWNISNVENMKWMFGWCNNLKSVGNLSNWDVSNVKEMEYMFHNSAITNKPDWYKE